MAHLFHSFPRRLAFSSSLIIVISMSVTAFVVTQTMKRQMIRMLTQDLTEKARLIETQLNKDFLQPERAEALRAFVRDMGMATQVRVTIIDKNGVVMGDSSVPDEEITKMESHAGRPEFKEALIGTSAHSIRFSKTLRQELLYSAIPLVVDGRVEGVLRLAISLKDVHREVGQANQTIFVISLILILIAVLLSYRFSKSMAAPLDEISKALFLLAEGRTQTRIGPFKSPLFDELGQAVNRLAEKIQSAIRDLDRDKGRLASILSNMVESVIAVDAANRIVVMNPAASKVFNVKSDEIDGKSFNEALRHHQLIELVQTILKEQISKVEEVSVFNPEDRTFLVHGVPLIQEGELRGALLVLHDVTRLKNLEQIRRDFVANVSHELRTPLASIRGYAETLSMGGWNDVENRDQFVHAIQSQTDRMIQLINDLLDLSKIESGTQTFNREEIFLPDVATEIMNSMTSLARQKKVTLSVQFPPEFPSVPGDRIQLKQVFTNLIENAIKFNREGGTVKIGFDSTEKDVTISVQDTGIGIPKKDLPRIFERFFRVDKARSREMGGTGLGLSIVKHIIEVHRGSISVQSEEGVGSVFVFTLLRSS